MFLCHFVLNIRSSCPLLVLAYYFSIEFLDDLQGIIYGVKKNNFLCGDHVCPSVCSPACRLSGIND